MYAFGLVVQNSWVLSISSPASILIIIRSCKLQVCQRKLFTMQMLLLCLRFCSSFLFHSFPMSTPYVEYTSTWVQLKWVNVYSCNDFLLFSVAANMFSSAPWTLSAAAVKIYMEWWEISRDLLTCWANIAFRAHRGALFIFHYEFLFSSFKDYCSEAFTIWLFVLANNIACFYMRGMLYETSVHLWRC